MDLWKKVSRRKFQDIDRSVKTYRHKHHSLNERSVDIKTKASTCTNKIKAMERLLELLVIPLYKAEKVCELLEESFKVC